MRKYSDPFRETDDLLIGYINGDPVATKEFKKRAYETWSTNVFEEFYRTTSIIGQTISQSFRRWWHGEQKDQAAVSEEGK